MKAKVTEAFQGRPDNEQATRTIDVGEVIDGELAAVAVEQGWATEVKAPAKKAAKAAKKAK